jgi:hypothetical protein
MGTRFLILLVSLALNLALTFILSRGQHAPPVAVGATELISTPQVIDSALPDSMPPPTPTANAGATLQSEIPAFHWSQLESEDYREYIARLRGFSVPERTIRDIIVAEVNSLYRPRLAALRPPAPVLTNFWEQRGGQLSPRRPKEEREQLRALEKEKAELIKSLLGKDVYQEIARDSGETDWMERSFGNLSPNQRAKVTEMNERFQQVNSEIRAKADGHIDQETDAELKRARRGFLGELATVLTPEQIEEYQLRSSDTASNMKYQLRTFEPNEEEFRAVFKYKQAKEDWDLDRSAATARPSTEELKARQQQQKELEDELAKALGPDRAKELKLSESYEFQNLLEAGVPKENVFKVAEMKEDVEAAARKIRQDQSMTSEQRTAALATMRAETEKAMTDLLGGRRARGYIANGGHWLRSLAPRQ